MFVFSKLPWLWRVWPGECLQSPGEDRRAGSQRCPGESQVSKHGSHGSQGMGTEFTWQSKVWVQSLHGSRKSGYRVNMAVRKSRSVWVQSLHGSEEIGSKETGSEDQTVHMWCTHFLGRFL